TWQGSIQTEINENQLKEKKTKQRTLIALSSILLIPCAVVFGIYEIFFFMLLAIILFVALLLFAGFYTPRTIKGARIKKEWHEFRQSYSHIDLKEWAELKDDDQQRAFIYGVGVNDKHIREKNETLLTHFPKTIMPQTDGAIDPVMFMLLISAA